jgi:quercetin dioxygenase-like cupin family protein
MSVKHSQDVEKQIVRAGENVSIQVLISGQEGPNFAMRKFVIEPDGGMPEHTNSVEHEQYVLRGCAKIGIGNEVFEVQCGDVVFIPQGVHHWYSNVGEDKFEFLCIVPNKEDQITVITKGSG